ncbi:MAG TPA: PCYCGC motif-containing (lipo)protein [Anaerolineales bacterium]|nr:PCYCGC motif-containing (lipo)protein [Anaerolineales bacterium]
MSGLSLKHPFRLSLIFLSLVMVALSGALAGCASQASAGEHELAMAPLHSLPKEMQEAPAVVSQAYQFAAANPEVVQQLPCYCGCGSMGHTSNYDCYIAGVEASGAITYDPHALGCSICVDITQDAMRLLRQGKTVPEIRAYVDATYAKYGPSNMP